MGARCLRCLRRRSSWARRSRCCAEVGGQGGGGAPDGRGGKRPFARPCFRAFPHGAGAGGHGRRSRRHAGCSVGGRRVLLRGTSPKTRLVCFAGCAGGDVFSVLGRGAGDGRALSSGFRCGAGRIGRRLRGRFLHGGSGCRALLLLAAVGAAAGLLTLAFCGALEKLRGGLARLRAPVFALAVGGVATALVVGYADLFHYEDVRSYCGTGLSQIEAALAGEALPWWAFIVKAALTLLTLAGGFKGGEIMPVLATGACLGAAVFSAASPLLPASILGAVGASRSLGALVGMVAFFAACTNCPLTALAFAGELFGFASLPATIVAIAPACLIARRVSLYPTSLQRARGKCQFDPRFGVSRCQLRGALPGNASSTRFGTRRIAKRGRAA